MSSKHLYHLWTTTVEKWQTWTCPSRNCFTGFSCTMVYLDFKIEIWSFFISQNTAAGCQFDLRLFIRRFCFFTVTIFKKSCFPPCSVEETKCSWLTFRQFPLPGSNVLQPHNMHCMAQWHFTFNQRESW